MFKTPIGYKAICEQLKLSTLPHYCESYVIEKGRGRTIIENDHEIKLTENEIEKMVEIIWNFMRK